MVLTSDLLTIQKFVFLLDEFHYKQFTRHLEEINAQLPLKLCHFIRKKMPGFDTHEALCKKMYGKYEKNERLTFNQLASYTFKLSYDLAINYPSYLSPNYAIMQRLVNEGKTEPANFLAKVMLEVAEKTEDHTTEIFVLKFLVQQAFLMKQSTSGVRLTQQLSTVYENEKLCSEILSDLRLHLNIALDAAVSAERLTEFKNKFLSYFKHPAASVRLLGKYAYIYTIYYHESEKFKEPGTRELVKDLEKDLENNSHIIFPFAFDLKSNFSFYMLNLPGTDLTSKTGKKEFEDLKKHYNSVKFWKSYLNIPEMFGMALQASSYLTAYHHYVHRSDYNKMVPAEDMLEIKGLIEKCSELLSHKDLEKYYKNDLINLKLIYSGLLILSGGAGIKKGAEELEFMLISYQQINLAGTADSIFLFLMLAYFSMRSYDKCATTFKRYIKAIKGKPMFEDNDIEIHAYYYLSQWLSIKSNQYLAKLKSTYERTQKSSAYAQQATAIEELVGYFELSIDL